jgi:hypothetical protein
LGRFPFLRLPLFAAARAAACKSAVPAATVEDIGEALQMPERQRLSERGRKPLL